MIVGLASDRSKYLDFVQRKFRGAFVRNADKLSGAWRIVTDADRYSIVVL